MGNSFLISWFGKSVEELKAILEKEELTDEQRKQIEKLIDEKEKESK
jgi:Spy/CpxP family protein refolding chaperone